MLSIVPSVYPFAQNQPPVAPNQPWLLMVANFELEAVVSFFLLLRDIPN